MFPGPTIGVTSDNILSLYKASILSLWANCFPVKAESISSSGFDNSAPC